MTVYAIAQIAIHDRPRYERYMERFVAALGSSGGTLLIADERPEVREGAWPYEKLIVMAFETREALERWSSSDTYRALAAERAAASEGVVLVARGLARAPGR